MNRFWIWGVKCFFSSKPHESGSDRIAEALEVVDADLIVNVQGDEPFQDPKSLKDLVAAFERPKVKMASLMCRIPEDEAYNPNAVKVVVDEKNECDLFFPITNSIQSRKE
ncbi:cytidylyltransferase domain-containing protein [Algoriphagus boritolerans]|uniref:cytidylyltransferase domain-containing protein n=1 Tax=Algoriphagus boritolerans TaxID=308111 RepID=UPI002FCE26FF